MCASRDAIQPFVLSAEQRMLLQMRDTLYEGSWDDFLHDLRARCEARPHVFEIIPDSPEMKTTVAQHIRLIEQMREFESQTGQVLNP